jgi:hypothetical protein
VRGGKGNDLIEPIVRDILVPVQGDYALCVEIANRVGAFFRDKAPRFLEQNVGAVRVIVRP